MMHTAIIEPRTSAGDVEFVAYGLSLPPGLPSLPGVATGDDTGTLVKHIAPDRWFAPAASEATRALLARLTDYGTCVDVTGKWSRIDVTGPNAVAVLSASIDIRAVLRERACASVTLFDCPSLVLQLADGYAVWTTSSYRRHLLSEFQRLAGG